MTDAVEVAVESALLARAAQFANNNSLTIAMPNIAFVAPTSTKTAKYLRASLLPAPSYSPGIGFSARNQHYGILQLDVFYGEGGGPTAPKRIATDIIAYFKRGTTLTSGAFSVQIWKAPYLGPLGGLKNSVGSTAMDDPWVMLPVSIPYVTFASPPA